MIVLSLLMLLISSCNALYVKDAHYKAFLKSNDCVVLQFASPSNPDSNRLLDYHEKAAEHVPGCAFRFVDVHKNPLMVHDFEVTHTPYVVMVRGEERIEYDGGRTQRELVQWADKLTHPLVRTVTRKDEWDTLQEHHDHVVLGVGVSREHLERHAREHPNKVFAHNPVGPKHVLYKRPHAEEPIKFEHPHHLHHHLDRHAFESVKDCDHAHINAVLEHGRHKAVLMLWNFDNAHEVAEIESGDVVTCVLQPNSPLLEHYGVKGLKRAYLATKGHTYQQEHDSVHEFVDEWRRGNLKPYHKSGAPSLAATGLPRLQAHTHDDVVTSGKNVLVLYHARTPACRRLERMAKEVHERMLGDPTFEVRSINVNEEHAHHISLPHVPAFKLYTAAGQVHDVDQELSAVNIVRFVKDKNQI